MHVIAAPRSALVVFTLLVTWLVWGSSFVAISWALESMPPLLLMSTRFVVAGAVALLAGLLLARRSRTPLPCARAWRDATIVGAGLITVGMGATGWAVTRLPTGTAALLVASGPLWIAMLQFAFIRERRQGPVALSGIAVGIGGVALLCAPGGDGSIDLAAALVLVASNAAWAAASLFAPRAAAPGGLVVGVGMQMLTGGAILLAISLLVGEGHRFDLGTMTGAATGGWLYLVLAAAIGGFLAYNWLLEHVSAGTASTHAFVNPLVAVALGAVVLGEQLDARVLVSGVAVVVAVVLLLVGEAATRASVDRAEAPAERPRAASRPARVGARRSASGWAPAPTPAFARRHGRPWQATDGMDALAIDEAFDGLD